MQNNIFITGPPRSGKSTLVAFVVKECGLKTAGLLTPEIRSNNQRVGFALKDIATENEGVLAHVNLRKGPRLGRYAVDLKDLARFTKLSLTDIPEDTELVVIDEIGKMEMFSHSFKEAVDNLLGRNIKVLAVLHRDLVEEYGEKGIVYRLGDFEEVKAKILKEIST